MRHAARGHETAHDALASLLDEYDSVDLACACAAISPGPSKVTMPERHCEQATCAICFGGMGDTCDSTIWTCEMCNNSLHADCFARWRRHSKRGPTCPYCRHVCKEEPEGLEGRCCAIFLGLALLGLAESAVKAHMP